MANSGPNTNASQFYITTRGDDLEYLDGKHTIFGEIAEGMEVLDKINELYVDKDNRPYQDVRIKHTYVLDDPFPDPELLVVPPESPKQERPDEETVEVRLAADERLDEDDAEGRTEEEIEKSLREKEAKSRAVVLEMIGDIPDADVKPPEEVLFVCKLNPITESSDLDMAFCRFGPCKSEVIRDFKTGDSLCFAFVEFTDQKHCEEAYFKMNNVLMDDRRIKVDFSQSVSKLWNKFARRPWEKHSRSDGDPYASEKRGNSNGGKTFGNGRRPIGGGGTNLRLKTRARAGDEYDLVDEDDDARDARHHARKHQQRDDGDRRFRHDKKRSLSPEQAPRHHRDRSRGDRDTRRSRSRDRSDDRRRKRSASRDKVDKRERGRDRDDDRRRSRDRHDDKRESSRKHDSKRSRSRSRRRDSEHSKRR